MDTEELLYDNRYHGFTLALATMYLTRAQKAEVYGIYDSAVASGVAASDVISESLAIAGKYDIRCQNCNAELGEDVTALCGSCLLHFGGIKEYYDSKPELYDLDFINSDVDLPWVWLQNDD